VKIAMVSEHAGPLAALGGVDAGGQNVHVAALSSVLAAAESGVPVVHTFHALGTVKRRHQGVTERSRGAGDLVDARATRAHRAARPNA
jgi:hypothetical protein